MSVQRPMRGEMLTLVSDHRWQVLVNARPVLVDAFFHEGVIRVEYVSAFPDQQPFAVWLGTATDSEAARLRTSPTIRARMHDVLVANGFKERSCLDHDQPTQRHPPAPFEPQILL